MLSALYIRERAEKIREAGFDTNIRVINPVISSDTGQHLAWV